MKYLFIQQLNTLVEHCPESTQKPFKKLLPIKSDINSVQLSLL